MRSTLPRAFAVLLSCCGVNDHAVAQALQWSRFVDPVRWYAQAPAPTPWSDARDWARSFGGELVSVRSAAEQQFLAQNFFELAPPSRFHWLGLHQDPLGPNYSEPAGGWSWSSGEPLTYVNWTPGAPDDFGGGENVARTLGASNPARAGEWCDSRELSLDAPTGLLDWRIGPGQIVIFNTANAWITLGQLTVQVNNPSFPNDPQNPPSATFLPTSYQLVQGGVVRVRHFYLEQGGVLWLEGPNAFHLIASGEVWIRGRLIADGGHAPDAPFVGGIFRGPLDTAPGTIPAMTFTVPGGVGRVGGGDGGSSEYGSVAEAIGSAGEGAFGASSAGGGGGESGWSSTFSHDTRRAGGGGGGRLGADQLHPAPPTASPLDQRRIGFDAESGFDNLQAANGAIGGPGPARGGARGPTPFQSPRSDDDFFGVARERFGDAFVLGELERPWAGSGGGAGGAAYYAAFGWPPTPLGEQLGGAGGGGGGSVRVSAIGAIRFGWQGSLRARGGFGAGGSSTSFLNRVGGGGGGGSGGHVVLESAALIDLRACPLVDLSSPTDMRFAIDARGGQGGPGKSNLGGTQHSSSGPTETFAPLDACPPGHPTSGENSCRGHVNGAGGDGGPGIVQLHTPRGSVGTSSAVHDILLPSGGATIERLTAPRPLMFGDLAALRAITSVGGGLGVFQIDSDDCDSDGEPDRYTIAVDPARDLDASGALDDCEPVVAFCGGALSANGCEPVLASTGSASASAASGFQLLLSNADEARPSTLSCSLTRASPPFNAGGQWCLRPPVRRIAALSTSGAGGGCDGSWSFDWNTWRAANPSAFGANFAAGDVLYAQVWLRAPLTTSGALSSNALRFTLQP